MNGSSPSPQGNRTTFAVIVICILVILACFVIRGFLKKEESAKEKEETAELRKPGREVVQPPPETTTITPTPETTGTPPSGEEATEAIEQPGEAKEHDIAGTVVDKDGNPIPGATVELLFYSWDDFSMDRLAETVGAMEPLKHETKEDGRFGFTYRKGKRYFISAQKEDYIQAVENLSEPKQDIVLTLTAGGAIEGNVVDAVTGQPVEDFRIATAEDSGGGFIIPLFQKKEVDIYLPTDGKEFHDPAGKFGVSGLAGGKYRVTSIAEGYAQSYKTGINVEPEKTTSGILIKQQPAGGICGHVLDAIGKPIEAAEIIQRNPIHSELFGEIRLPERKILATTKAQGEFEISGLPDGTFTLQARHANYCPEEQEVKVKKGEVTENVQFQLVQGGLISGVVLAKVDSLPIAGATVKATTGSSFIIPIPTGTTPEAKTDANGMFDIIKLEPGSYDLVVAAEDYADKTVEGLTLKEGDSITDLIIELSQGGSLVGTVRDTNGDPIAAKMIVAVGPGGQKMTQTDEAGDYALKNLKEGVYTAGAIEISMATRQMGASGAEMHFVRVENDKETRLDMTVGGPRKVYGKVTLKGEPQAGIMVSLQSSNKQTAATKSQKQGSDTTNENGDYEIDNLQRGEYSLGAIRMVSMMPAPLCSMEITIGDKDIEKDIELPEGGISGKVMDAENRKPIEGATLTLEGAKATDIQQAAIAKLGLALGGSATTDGEGKYAFSIVEDGNYYVVAKKEGYAPQALTATVRNGRGPTDLDFSLSTGETLSGRVTFSDPSRQPKQIHLSAKSTGGGTVYREKLSLNEQGEYTATGLAPDEYAVSVDAIGYASGSQKVTIRSGGGNRADFTLTAGGTLVIEVVDDRGQPITGPTVELLDEQGAFYLGFFPDLKELMNMGFEAIARTDGLDISRNISPGNYRAKVGALGYEDETVNVTVREGEETREKVTLRKIR